MSIFTRNGDSGMTSLAGGKRVPKDDLRVEAYGTLDELQSFVGMLASATDEVQLEDVQRILFKIGGFCCRCIRELKSIRLNTDIWNCRVIEKICHSTMATLLL